MHKINHNINYLSNNHHRLDDNIYVNNTNDEVLKHIESLRTRLGFAKFKLSNGWENNTLGDVECFWKQKQRQSIRDIPIPRFTQQDIIDKRSYIQASGAKHAKARRYRLLSRSYSHPTTSKQSPILKKNRRKNSSSHTTQQQQEKQQQQYISNDDEEDNDSSNSSIISSSSSTHHHHQQEQEQQQQEQQYYFHHYDKDAYRTKKAASLPPKPTPIHSVSSFDASCVPNDLNGEPSVVKNSLDYITYAIAMTERNQSQEDMEGEEEDVMDEEKEEDHLKEDWTKTSQLRLSLSIPSSSTAETSTLTSSPPSPTPSSPTNAAAQAMLMFVRNQSSSSSSA